MYVGQSATGVPGLLPYSRCVNSPDMPQHITVAFSSTCCSALSLTSVPGEDASSSGIRVGDRVLEVNGQSVRGLDHEEVGRIIAGGPEEAVLLLHSQKPAPTPDG